MDNKKIAQLPLENSAFHSKELIETLSLRITELQKQLEHEMAVTDNYIDLNAQLKATLSGLRQKNKVIAHPSTINTLTEAVKCSELRVEQLREALIIAISLIPYSRSVEPQLARLRQLARSY